MEAFKPSAAHYFRQRHASHTGDRPVVVYDFGGGTFDVSVVSGTRVLATGGLDDAGGLDIDTALIAHLETTYRERDPAAWDWLRHPTTPDERRAWRQFSDDVRGAKEMLSRTAQTFVHIPLVDVRRRSGGNRWRRPPPR